MDKLDYLRNNGVECDTAIENMFDVDTYNEMLEDYFEALPNDFNNLVNYKNNGDMPNYAIQVHAMKSNARSFGFMKLGEIAYSHEMQSKAGDVNFVNEHFFELEEEVKNVINIITNYRAL